MSLKLIWTQESELTVRWIEVLTYYQILIFTPTARVFVKGRRRK